MRGAICTCCSTACSRSRLTATSVAQIGPGAVIGRAGAARGWPANRHPPRGHAVEGRRGVRRGAVPRNAQRAGCRASPGRGAAWLIAARTRSRVTSGGSGGELDPPAAEQPVDLGAVQERAEVAGKARRGTLDDLMRSPVDLSRAQSAIHDVNTRIAEILDERARHAATRRGVRRPGCRVRASRPGSQGSP